MRQFALPDGIDAVAVRIDAARPRFDQAAEIVPVRIYRRLFNLPMLGGFVGSLAAAGLESDIADALPDDTVACGVVFVFVPFFTIHGRWNKGFDNALKLCFLGLKRCVLRAQSFILVTLRLYRGVCSLGFFKK